ncbi:MAG: hypothetical protein WCQ21_09165 [Verrucomicrobiota bacterium]
MNTIVTNSPTVGRKKAIITGHPGQPSARVTDRLEYSSNTARMIPRVKKAASA